MAVIADETSALQRTARNRVSGRVRLRRRTRGENAQRDVPGPYLCRQTHRRLDIPRTNGDRATHGKSAVSISPISPGGRRRAGSVVAILPVLLFDHADPATLGRRRRPRRPEPMGGLCYGRCRGPAMIILCPQSARRLPAGIRTQRSEVRPRPDRRHGRRRQRQARLRPQPARWRNRRIPLP